MQSISSGSAIYKPERILVARVHGLDTIRFFCSFWVVMSHCGPLPLTGGYTHSEWLPRAINGFWNGFFSGPAAVIVFFLVSGFCIHFPFREQADLFLAKFWLRRYIRIGLPLAGAVVCNHILQWSKGTEPDHLFVGIPAWSLVAEMIYYGMYPLLRRLAFCLGGWRKLLMISFCVGLALALTRTITNVNYSAWGYSLDWVLGLPCWLMGVVLAEQFGSQKASPVSSRSIWAWRFGIIFLAGILRNLSLQLVVGHHLTLNFFAIAAFFWLRKEIDWFSVNKTRTVLEWAGAWSYSVYLMHMFGHEIYNYFEIAKFGFLLAWLIQMTIILGVSYLFYLLCEKPAHQLARVLAR